MHDTCNVYNSLCPGKRSSVKLEECIVQVISLAYCNNKLYLTTLSIQGLVFHSDAYTVTVVDRGCNIIQLGTGDEAYSGKLLSSRGI